MCGGSLDCAQTEAPTHKADSRGRLSLQKNKLRAGRSARDRIQILLYALGGEKSVIGGICNPSVAPHLRRKSLREVRSEFSRSADGAAGRSNRRFAHFFFGIFFLLIALGNEWVTEKSALSPLQREFVRRGECVRR